MYHTVNGLKKKESSNYIIISPPSVCPIVTGTFEFLCPVLFKFVPSSGSFHQRLNKVTR